MNSPEEAAVRPGRFFPRNFRPQRIRPGRSRIPNTARAVGTSDHHVTGRNAMHDRLPDRTSPSTTCTGTSGAITARAFTARTFTGATLVTTAIVSAALGAWIVSRLAGPRRAAPTGSVASWSTRLPNRQRRAKLDLIRFEDDGTIPNNPRLPLVHYHAALPPPELTAGNDPAEAFEDLFRRNDWGGTWRDGVYDYHHYHSTAHEVLGIARGEARLRLGGENGVSVAIRAGDAILIPAGVGHKNEGASADLLVVGAYPRGQVADLCTGTPEERNSALPAIARVALPAADPVLGHARSASREWRR
jgi:uncharacterized protein YjlB